MVTDCRRAAPNLHLLHCVIAALYETGSDLLVGWWSERHVVHAPTHRINPPPIDSLRDDLVGDVEVNYEPNPDADVGQQLCLLARSWKPIQQDATACRVRLLQSLLQNLPGHEPKLTQIGVAFATTASRAIAPRKEFARPDRLACLGQASLCPCSLQARA